MALAELLRALREEAAERRSAVLSSAESEAESIRSSARGELARRQETFLMGVQNEEEEVARRTISRARAEGARAVLDARDHLLRRVRDKVEQRIGSPDLARTHAAMLEAEIRTALERLPPGPVTVSVAPALAAVTRRAVEHEARVTVEVADELGPGFVARHDAEGVEVDGLLQSRLVYAWPRLAIAVLEEVAR